MHDNKCLAYSAFVLRSTLSLFGLTPPGSQRGPCTFVRNVEGLVLRQRTESRLACAAQSDTSHPDYLVIALCAINNCVTI
eukprot:1895046-Heterocapsa_arctica.AAC.1